MIATHRVRTLDVSAASGLVLRGDSFHVVADDENALFVFGQGGSTRRVPLLHGDLPEKKSARKKEKADFEILVDLAGDGLLAMGSGSRATRQRAVLVDHRESTTVIDTAPLCAGLRDFFPDLNLEGGVLLRDEFVLLQRGNRSDRRTALIYISGGDLQNALVSRQFVLTCAPRIVDVELGAQDAVPWTCTDLALVGDGDLLASAVLEDTSDSDSDGACLGSSLVRIAPDGTIRWHRRLECTSKVEGIAMDGEFVWLVSDADDRAVPSQLSCAALR